MQICKRAFVIFVGQTLFCILQIRGLRRSDISPFKIVRGSGPELIESSICGARFDHVIVGVDRRVANCIVEYDCYIGFDG